MEMMSWIRQQAEMLVLIQLFLYFAPELHMWSSEDLQPQLQRSGSGRINGSDRNHYSGGIFNMFGNYFFVFTLDRGIMGAGIATDIIRRYGISFILLPFNIFSTYYFQAMMKPSTAFVVSVGRGAVISGVLIFLLLVMAGANSIWFAMPITELIVAVFVAAMMRRYQKQPIRSAVQK